MVDRQLNQAKYFLKQLEVCPAHPKEADSTDKHQRKMTEKGREYKKEVIGKKRANLVSRIIRKSCEIDLFLLSPEWCHCEGGISSVEWNIQANKGYLTRNGWIRW